MRINISMILIISAVVFMSACADSDTAAAEDKIALKRDISDDDRIIISSETVDNSDEEEDDQQKNISYDSIAEFFKGEDPYWNESDEYREAVKAYEKSIGQETVDEFIINNGGVGEARIGFGYIDEDDIPELFVATGAFHPVGVNIYTYLPESGEVVWLGEFSSFGRIDYLEKGNRFMSGYGGMGSYILFFSKIENGKAVLTGSVASGSRKVDRSSIDSELADIYEKTYFAGYDIPENVDGSTSNGFSAADVEWPDDRYLVTEEEYDRVMEEISGDDSDRSSYTILYYDAMKSVSLVSGGDKLASLRSLKTERF